LEKINIQILDDVVIYLNHLTQLLFEKEYFGFEDAAHDYVDKIYNFIEFDLITFPHKRTPNSLKKFGSKYLFYRPNNRTTWYIFFENYQNRYLITFITNNHEEIAKEL
jgi:hypothetical protein